MFPNARPSEIVAVLGTINPVSQGAGTVSTGWVSMAEFNALLAVIDTGVLGASATVDAKLQQATDSSGTSAKDITGKAITQIVKASGDNKQALINLRGSELDVTNSFNYVRLSITVGTAASLVSAALIGFSPRFGDASASNQAGVVQVVA
jgi:hypothetical protein